MDTSQLNGKSENKSKGTEIARYLDEGGFVVVDPSTGNDTSVEYGISPIPNLQLKLFADRPKVLSRFLRSALIQERLGYLTT